MHSRHERLYHLALRQDWETARAGNIDYRISTLGEDLADVGFVHCSYASQVQRVADLVYRDRDDVVLLGIDPDALTARVVIEAADEEGSEEFPHVYGPIDLDAVVEVTPLALRPDGTLALDAVTG